jgi:hypothetical protein
MQAGNELKEAYTLQFQFSTGLSKYIISGPKNSQNQRPAAASKSRRQ